MDPLLVFAENLRAVRKAQQLSQEGLAHAAGIQFSQVGRIERGRVDPGVRTVARLARGLNVEVSALFVGVPHADDDTPRRPPRGSASTGG